MLINIAYILQLSLFQVSLLEPQVLSTLASALLPSFCSDTSQTASAKFHDMAPITPNACHGPGIWGLATSMA